jgi:hypothetical protein
MANHELPLVTCNSRLLTTDFDLHHLRGPSNLTAATLLYRTASTSMFLQEGECGRAPCSRTSTSSSPSRSTWIVKSTDASCACMTSSPRRNSSVILAMTTQVSGRGPRVSFTEASYKIWRASLDAVCRARRVGWSLSGRPAVMSGLAMVTDASVSIYKTWLVWYPSLGF